MSCTAPQLHFDFHGQPLHLRNAREILIAETYAQVLPLLERASQALASGYAVGGYLAYEAAWAWLPKPHPTKTLGYPLLYLGIYDLANISTDFSLPQPALQAPLEWRLDTDYPAYSAQIETIKQELAAGNSYQVNLTQRLYATLPENFNSGSAYAFLSQHNTQISYAAWLDLGRWQVLSLSPELFFARDGNTLTTRPMKGTVGRSADPKQDILNQQWLAQDLKNRAENLMIVDLLRNDLNTISHSAHTHADSLFSIEPYADVWQMTSSIKSQLGATTDLASILKALFPCGSITGAPKLNTMHIIEQLERSPRGIYCGAIGYALPNQQWCFNVAIRTLVIDQQERLATYGVGGGIVWDSTPAEEFSELNLKAKAITRPMGDYQLIECLRLEDGILFRQQDHLNRLRKSAQILGFICDKDTILEQWQAIAKAYPKGCYKVRCLLHRKGRFQCTATPIDSQSPKLHAVLSQLPIDSNLPELAHKTTLRDCYDRLRCSDADETLLYNEHGYLTEFINGNLVIERDGTCLTPPLSDGLLPGVMRQSLLQKKKLQEQSIHRSTLEAEDKIWLLNSVRGWVEVKLTHTR